MFRTQNEIHYQMRTNVKFWCFMCMFNQKNFCSVRLMLMGRTETGKELTRCQIKWWFEWINEINWINFFLLLPTETWNFCCFSCFCFLFFWMKFVIQWDKGTKRNSKRRKEEIVVKSSDIDDANLYQYFFTLTDLNSFPCSQFRFDFCDQYLFNFFTANLSSLSTQFKINCVFFVDKLEKNDCKQSRTIETKWIDGMNEMRMIVMCMTITWLLITNPIHLTFHHAKRKTN